MDNSRNEFFMEIGDEEKAKSLTKSALLNILNVAEEGKAKDLYVCVRNSLETKVFHSVVK